MSEKFLREYALAMAEANNIEITDEQLDDVVNDLMCNDELFDLLDSFIWSAFEDNEIKVNKEDEEE